MRIFTFGGSTMWSFGERDDHTIASYLSKLLHAWGYRVQVTNCGESTYVNTQAVIALLRNIHCGEVPDLALFYDSHNNVSTSAGNRKAGIPNDGENRRAEFELLDRPQRLWEYAIQQLPVAYLWGFDRLATRLRRGLRSSADHGAQANRSRSLDERLTRQTLHMYAANLAFITALGHCYGFDALSYWHPDLSSKRCCSPGERIVAAQADSSPRRYSATSTDGYGSPQP